MEAPLVSTMNVSSLCEHSVSEYVNCLHYLISHENRKQHSCSKNSTSEDYVATELGNALSEVLHFQDANELVPDSVPASYSNTTSQMENGKECDESKIHLACLSSATTQSALNRSTTFPCSKTEMSDKGLQEPNEHPACTRSNSLPVPLKLVPAIKGGREKHGIPQKKLTVTWAHEVYDPPITSVSHSVKGGLSHHRSRSSKKSSSSSSSSSKHKHKGKSSRSSNSDYFYKKQYRKHSGHSESRPKPVASKDRLLFLNHINGATVELSDFAVASGHDAKCGSSYSMKSLTEMHLPVAEAT